MQLPALSSIVGHTLQVRLLARVVRGGRVGHAYLFAGPAGVGRRTTALAVLARLACVDPPQDSADPCGACRSCAALRRGHHPDLTTIAPEGQHIKIDQIREMTGRLRYEPVVGRAKGVVVCECDRLHETAANALLKTLEEPAAATHFVLLTSKPAAVIDTIRSRCQLVRFGELSPQHVAELLAHGGVAPDLAHAVSALAAGSIDHGRALADPGKLALLDLVAELALSLGTVPPDEGVPWIEQLARALAAAKKSEAQAESAAEPDGDRTGEPAAPTEEKKSRSNELSRDDLSLVGESMRAVLRDALLVACGVDADGLPHARHKAALLALASRCDPKQIADVLDQLLVFERALAGNANTKLAWAAMITRAGQTLA
ncbi:MAG: DNA polymerase III subunit delta' [Deltaproteobacteria bacterium]|nr:DNA polymerase III subunit delta' [Deltaproteobacteria bacterium]